jgi:hypothetical protein
MTPIYEFHVAGRVGSVIRSALPEMHTFEQHAGRTVHGTGEPQEIDELLTRIESLNLVVQSVHICARSRSRIGDHVPVVDDGGAQHDVLQ